MQGPAGRRFYGQAANNGLGCESNFEMSNSNVDTVKGVLILAAFLIAAAWLIWCGEIYDDHRHSMLPLLMCGVESILLALTGAMLAGKHFEREWESELNE